MKNNENKNNGKNNETMKGGKTMKKATIPYKHNGNTFQMCEAILKDKVQNINFDNLNDQTRHAIIDFVCKSDECGKIAIAIKKETETLNEKYKDVISKHKNNATTMSEADLNDYAKYLVEKDAISEKYKKDKQDANSAKKKAIKTLVGENSKIRVTDKNGTTYTLYQAYAYYVSTDRTKSGIFKDAVKDFFVGTGVVTDTDSYANGAFSKVMSNFITTFGLKSASDAEKYNGEMRCKVMSQSAFNELFADKFTDMVHAMEAAMNSAK